MIIDIHYHLDEHMETVDRVLDHMSRRSIGRVCLISALNDPFTIDWLTMKTAKPTQKALNGRWRKVGLRVYGSTVTRNGKFVIGIGRYTIYDHPDNESVARILKSHQDKFFGWITVNPNTADPIEEIQRWVKQPGWIGVKTHPFMHRYPVRMLDNVADYCTQKGRPILMHLGTTRERGDYRFLPDRHSHLRIIYAHAGLPFFRVLWDYARGKDNVFVDLSCSLLDKSVLLAAVSALGARKCLYGSDSPYGLPLRPNICTSTLFVMPEEEACIGSRGHKSCASTQRQIAKKPKTDTMPMVSRRAVLDHSFRSSTSSTPEATPRGGMINDRIEPVKDNAQARFRRA